MRSIYLYLEIDKATLTEQGSKQVIKAGENEAVKKDIKKTFFGCHHFFRQTKIEHEILTSTAF